MNRYEFHRLFRTPCIYTPQSPDEPSADLPTRHIIAPRWHKRKVTPPRLPRRVIFDAAIEICAQVPVNPVFVDLPET